MGRRHDALLALAFGLVCMVLFLIDAVVAKKSLLQMTHPLIVVKCDIFIHCVCFVQKSASQFTVIRLHVAVRV